MTFREMLIELGRRRNTTLTLDQAITDLQWATQSILERLANWEEFRDNHPKPE